MKVSSFIGCFLCAWLCTQPVFATDELQIVGSRQIQIPVRNHSKGAEQARIVKQKTITVQRVRLSGSAKENLLLDLEHPSLPLTFPTHMAPVLPKKVDLGMNGVPVFDQGVHGTCTTFSNTAAIDAAIDGKDNISQVCLLQLGKTFNLIDESEPSGWSGEDGPVALGRLQQYGAIDKNYESTTGCGGLRHYPNYRIDTGDAMSIEDYTKVSYPLIDKVSWKSLLTGRQFAAKSVDKQKLLESLKTELAAGHRLTMGFLLLTEIPSYGAQGKFHQENDSWVLTPDVTNQLQARCRGKRTCDVDSHEAVVVGYDDDIHIMGNTGAFILRNSWGIDSGDEGNFYLSYDYFKTLSDEVQLITAN